MFNLPSIQFQLQFLFAITAFAILANFVNKFIASLVRCKKIRIRFSFMGILREVRIHLSDCFECSR